MHNRSTIKYTTFFLHSGATQRSSANSVSLKGRHDGIMDELVRERAAGDIWSVEHGKLADAWTKRKKVTIGTTDADRQRDDNTSDKTSALWSGTNKNRNVSTGPLTRLFACLLAPLTHSLAQDCSLRSRPPLPSLIRSLAHFAHSLARGKVNF